MKTHVWIRGKTSSGRLHTQRQCMDCGIWETAISRHTSCPQPEMPMPSPPLGDGS